MFIVCRRITFLNKSHWVLCQTFFTSTAEHFFFFAKIFGISSIPNAININIVFWNAKRHSQQHNAPPCPRRYVRRPTPLSPHIWERRRRSGRGWAGGSAQECESISHIVVLICGFIRAICFSPQSSLLQFGGRCFGIGRSLVAWSECWRCWCDIYISMA